MRRLHPIQNSNSTAVFLRHFFGCGGRELAKFLVIFSLFFISRVGQSQGRTDEVPIYTHLDRESLPTVSASRLNSEDLTIAVATDSQGNVYTLSFGKGVDKRDANGELLDGNFIDGLKSPMDLAIDNDGFIYIADFEAVGDDFSDNGQIKIYDQDGVYIRSILTSYFRPMGVDVDDNYVYIAEYNDGVQGPESTPSSRVRKVNKTTGTAVAVNTNIPIPYRIAVNSLGKVYVSKAGNGAAVLILSENLAVQGQLPSLQSPGSVVVDVFDYVHVIEYAGRINFGQLLDFANIGFNEAIDFSHKVYHGIEDKAFGIKIFDSGGVLRDFFKQEIKFPVDITFNSCDRMYVLNSDVIPFYHIENFLTHSFLPLELTSELVIYQRTPSADVTPPVASCVSTYTIDLAAGGTRTITGEDLNDGSFDQCGNVTIDLSKSTFTENDEGENVVDLIVTDEQGITSTCQVSVQVNIEDSPDTIDPVFENCPGTIEVTADAGECGAVVEYEFPKANDNSGNVDVTKTSGQDPDTFFTVGQHTIKFRATDEAGNFTECTLTIIVTDDEAPTITCPENIDETVAPGVTGIFINYSQPVYQDNCSVVEYEQTSGLPSGSEFPVGETITNSFTVTDASGKTATCSFTITLTEADDQEDPVIICPTDIEVLTDSRECGAVVEYEFPTATDNAGPPEITRLRGPESGAFFPIGETDIKFEARDAAGNFTECTLTITVTDDEDPEFTDCPSGVNAQLAAGETTTIVNFPDPVADDNCSGFTVTQTGGQESGTQFTEGTHPIEFTVTDASGKTAVCQFDVVVSPADANTPPTFTDCPEDINLNTEPGICGNVAIFSEPNAVDNENDPVTISRIDNGPSSGEIFPVGTTTIIYEATDGLNPPVTCSFDVIVVDNILPIPSCVSEFTLYLNEEGYGLLSADILDNGSSDNCGTVEMSLSKTRFEDSDVGDNTVVLTVTDAAGNTDTCETTVTVVAYEGTDVGCPEDITVPLSESGDFELRLQYSGNDENIELEVSKSYFTCDDLGTQVVTATYLGEYTGSCEINVTVIDDIDPVANCVQEIDLRLSASGTASLAAEDLNLNSFDNCGIPELSLSKTNFTTADVGTQQITFTATDGSGNTGTCIVTVNVLPNEDSRPVECVDRHLIQIGANGRAILNPRDLFTGGSGTAQFTVSKDTFTCNELGENTVTLNYETPDGQGSCEITVIVEDPEKRCEVPGEPAGDYIILYPNPGLGLVRFQTSPGLIIHSIEVFDMRGRFLFEKTYNDDQNSIFDYRLDLRKYQSGVYSLLIHTNEKQFLKRAIIKN